MSRRNPRRQYLITILFAVLAAIGGFMYVQYTNSQQKTITAQTASYQAEQALSQDMKTLQRFCLEDGCEWEKRGICVCNLNEPLR